MKSLFLLILLAIFFSPIHAFAQDTDAIIGEWYTQGGKSTIDMYKCGSLYCGKISWLKEPFRKDGTDKVDTHNPDKSKRNRNILGMDIVWGFKYKGKNKWSGGKIYDPDNGKTYSCKMRLDGTKLKVRGYIGFSFIGRTTVWTKKT
jgi:uncharacterized protein (DUF2147 family)